MAYDLNQPAATLAQQLLDEVLREDPDLSRRFAAARVAVADAKGLADEIGGDRKLLKDAWVVTRAPEDRQSLRAAIREADSASAVLEQALAELNGVKAEIAPLLRERWRAYHAQLKTRQQEIEAQIEALKKGALVEAGNHRRTWSGVDDHLQRNGFVIPQE